MLESILFFVLVVIAVLILSILLVIRNECDRKLLIREMVMDCICDVLGNKAEEVSEACDGGEDLSCREASTKKDKLITLSTALTAKQDAYIRAVKNAEDDLIRAESVVTNLREQIADIQSNLLRNTILRFDRQQKNNKRILIELRAQERFALKRRDVMAKSLKELTG